MPGKRRTIHAKPEKGANDSHGKEKQKQPAAPREAYASGVQLSREARFMERPTG